MKQKKVRTIVLKGTLFLVMVGAAGQLIAQEPNALYPKMAALDQYLITDRNAEIAMARSAAPESISRDAEVLVLGRHGYETAVKGTNGFVCIVERSWMDPVDDPQFWSTEELFPLCMNAPAARTHLLLTVKTTELALNGSSKDQLFDAIKTAFDKNELPMPEPGAMCYMMSKQQYFGPKFKNAEPHLMFWFPKTADMMWGAGVAGSPVYVHQYSPQPITEFILLVPKWSDGTPKAAPAAHKH
jgi:hypothetical protein